MSFVTGTLIIDAPASALNNSGEDIPGSRTDNTVAVKSIHVPGDGTYPYVSAQAFRYWLRDTLETAQDIEWEPSITKRETKVAYTDANPIFYWDDDLLGYMRAPSKSKKVDTSDLTPLEDDAAVTRSSPLRVSTLVSIAPARIVNDYNTMSRHEGDPVPYEHQFYRATLQGLISLDLRMAGKFFYIRRTGFRNLDSVRRELAEEHKLEHLENEKAYRFWFEERYRRVRALLLGLSRIQGGAKQTIHYTDVSPAVAILAVTRGGNHPFNYLFRELRGETVFNADAFAEALADVRPHLLSPVYVGWKPGYLPEQRDKAREVVVDGVEIQHVTPRSAFEHLTDWLQVNADAWDL